MSDKQVVDLLNIDLKSATNNLLLNMCGGLLPENLSNDECKLLEIKFGTNWFTNLGYYEPKYKKPTRS